MSCFGGRVTPDLYQNCCNANTLCEFDGDISSLVTEPIYVQKVFDAVLFNLQGMRSVDNQVFKPNIPPNHRVKRVIDIRCKRFFNPTNVDDPDNLDLDVNTSISGASFLRNCSGECLKVVGADGTFSEKILYADTSECDDKCMGTPIFGTQNISISGNVVVEIDLLLCDSCNNEVIFTIWSEVNIATKECPLVLTNFFEICMPSTIDTAFLPRFTEFCNSACESRLATNNYGRDLCIGPDGKVSANLIVAICVTCEKKIVVPVQLCVLSTGYAKPATQNNAICTTFPSLFPNQVKECDTIENCPVDPCEDDRHKHHHHDHKDYCHDNNPCNDNECCDYGNTPARRPQPRR